MKMLKLATLFGSALLIAGCNEGDTQLQDNIDTIGATTALFDPNESVIPYPNNLLFQGSLDGTLNIPYEETDSDAAVKAALNALDGFSTIAPITTRFSTIIDMSTLTIGESVRLFEVTLSGVAGAVVAINRELSSTEFAVGLDSSGSQLVITPRQALDAKTSYLVVLTNAINDYRGEALTADLIYAITKSQDPLINGSGESLLASLSNTEAQALEPLRQLTNYAETAANTFDNTLATGDIILSWSFTTQSIDDVLNAVKNTVDSNPIPTTALADTGNDTPLNGASIYAGTITLPYYLDIPSQTDPTAALTGYWQGAGESHLTYINPTPVSNGDQTIPLLVTIPNSAKPTGGWPVVIFQHGITGNRGSLLGIADTLASIGYAAVAIDLPLHGVTGNETNGTQLLRMANFERTFDMDLINNTTNAPGPDGIIDESGIHFINLTSLLTSRDNVRQAIADLFSLNRSLNGLDYDGGGADFDTTKVRFIGHSLGAMVGIPFLALDSSVGAATLGMPGGGIAKLLDGSATFGPMIAAGLGANGVVKGTADYESFMAATQTVVDAGDPLNYGAAAASGRGIHMIEVVGGNSSLADQVIPNNVLNITGTVPSPTAGTDPLAVEMGLSLVSTQGNYSGTHLPFLVRFNAGHHSSLLTPKDSLGSDDPLSAQVLAEMQAQTAGFITSNGTLLTISNSNVIE